MLTIFLEQNFELKLKLKNALPRGQNNEKYLEHNLVLNFSVKIQNVKWLPDARTGSDFNFSKERKFKLKIIKCVISAVQVPIKS
jgi:hypothetical protein